MRKWATGKQKIPKEVLRITQYALPTSRTWALSCVNGWLYMKYRDGVEKYTDQYIDENEFWSMVNE